MIDLSVTPALGPMNRIVEQFVVYAEMTWEASLDSVSRNVLHNDEQVDALNQMISSFVALTEPAFSHAFLLAGVTDPFHRRLILSAAWQQRQAEALRR